MKATYFYTVGALAMSFGIAACVALPDVPAPIANPAPAPVSEPVSQPAPPPPPVQSPAPMPTPAPAPPPVLSADWIEQSQTPGSWEYVAEPNETFALFSASSTRPLAIVRCDLEERLVGIGRYGNPSTEPVEMLIGTETRRQRIAATQRLPDVGIVAADLSPSDPLLDAIALSRGRFAIALSGQSTLYPPAWAEITRVIEDCR
ncbi:hypothetical protein [uncultured Erythrobacter sp.]|uniref:hypothetical protein n=1 Tax=uncultured Erythrobacter sp. TaxID=263913 RepID=UPI002626456B|nr:hypothetical protein [uncultured Erythrobacter sp.]